MHGGRFQAEFTGYLHLHLHQKVDLPIHIDNSQLSMKNVRVFSHNF